VNVIYRDHGLHEQFRFLTGNISPFPASLLAIVFAGLLMGLPVGYFKRKEIAALLENGQVIDMPRPEAQFLKPSELRRSPYNPSNTRKGFLYLFVLAGAAMGITKGLASPLPGDKIFTVLVTLLTLWTWVRSRRMEKDGLRKGEIVSFKE
jgi:hypothetical protein